MRIRIEEYKKLNNPITIDIRGEEKYKFSHIPNSISISMEELLLRPNLYLEKSKTYYIYCEQGIVTEVVCKELSKQGYNIIEILGGYESWLSS